MKKAVKRVAVKAAKQLTNEEPGVIYLSNKDAVGTESGTVKFYAFWSNKLIQLDKKKKTIRIFSGGKMSDSAKSRINAILEELNISVRLYRRAGQWWVRREDALDREFEDGLTLKLVR